MSEEFDNQIIKIVLIGETGTGKTNLINVYFDIKFNSNISATLTPESCSKELKIQGSNFLINIWDTAGQEKYRSMTKIFLKGAKIVIFVYDITVRETFDQLQFWVKSVEEILGKEPTLGLAGNKADLFDNQVVETKEGEQYAKEIGALFRETSAKQDAKGFKNFVQELLEEFLVKKGVLVKKEESIKLQIKNGGKKKCFC